MHLFYFPTAEKQQYGIIKSNFYSSEHQGYCAYNSQKDHKGAGDANNATAALTYMLGVGGLSFSRGMGSSVVKTGLTEKAGRRYDSLNFPFTRAPLKQDIKY